jgi:DNA (cytosine-5)-methyltransferase 1
LIGSKGKLYNRVGNSIVVPMVEALAKEVKEQILITSNEIKAPKKEMNLFDFEYATDRQNPNLSL